EAVLPLANHTLTLNGNNINGQLRVSGAANNSVVLSGSNYFLNILSDNDNCLDVTGAQGFIVHNGKVVSSPEFTGTPTVPTAENGNSSNQIASTEFVQNQLAFYDVLRLKGSIDATANPDYPAANAGDFYVISHAGKIGGVAGPVVEKQDTMLCIVDGSALGDHATVGENWILGQVNTDVDLEGVISDHLADKDIVRLKGSIDASVVPAPDYPSANAGDMWVIEKAGRIGGPSGPSVEKNDTIMCLKDEATPGANAGSHAAVGGNWMIGQVSTDLNLGTAFSTYLTINKTDHGWLDTDIGKMVVKTVGTGGEGDFTTASADNVNSAEVVGHISRIDSTSQFTINRIGHLKRLGTEWDALCGCGAGGLTEGDVYFLNTSGGSFYTKDISHLLPGNIDMPAFIALSATDVWYYGYRGAEVGGGTSFGKSFAATDFSGNIMTVTHGLNTKRPIIRVFDENDQPVEAIQSRPTTGNELNAQDITFSDEMIAEMSSFLWHVMVIGTGVPYTKTEIEIPDYEPVAQQHGVKILPNGAIYNFDDWHGVEGFLTGDHAFVVPYKQSLSNVFTGFEVIGWQGNGISQKINLKTGAGLHWTKNRHTNNQNNEVCDLLRGEHNFWEPNLAAAQLLGFMNRIYRIEEKQLSIANATEVNDKGSGIISWNWHYPMAKAWHAPGESSRKVPTPWGMVDSVESNPNSGLTGDQATIELYNPLTGNGCILYVGNSANRTLDHSGKETPGFMIAKALESPLSPGGYHSGLNGGTNPGHYYLLLDSKVPEVLTTTIWNNMDPTSSLISLGIDDNLNDPNKICICYYFCPVTGLQNFGGYTGDNTTQIINSGCKGGMFFVKERVGTGSWHVYDSVRGNRNRLRWNLPNIEDQDNPFGEFKTPSGFQVTTVSGYEEVYGHFGEQLIPQGNFDVYPSNPILANSSNNKVKIIFEYKGSAILNTELLVYATREPTPNWVQGTLTKLTDLADGYQLLSADIDISANANNTHMRWRLASNESTYTEHN
ncbi:MAG: hypothetical protein MI892_03095, partial [Desulfobacterales bacterium]|nr:hypothetical protein [Desulfobacterales bacterium]